MNNFPSRLRRSVIAIASSGVMMLTPVPAHAMNGVCDIGGTVWSMIESQVVDGFGDQLMNIVMTQFKQIMYKLIDGSTNSIASAIMKEVAADSQLLQAKLNYRALLYSNDRATEAYNRFASSSSYAYGTCQTAATNEAALKGVEAMRLAIKGTTGAEAAMDLYNDNSSTRNYNSQEEHRTTYCSTNDVAAGRNCTPAAQHLQNANLNAGSLMIPNGGQTFTPQEYGAARAYIRNATGSLPEMLPAGLENSPQGRRFVITQRSATAQMSVAKLALGTIAENNSKLNNFGSVVVGPVGDLSIKGLMHKMVSERFGSGNYGASLQGMNESALLREAIVNLTTANWMAYQTFLLNEPAELVAATHTAILARQDAEQRLGAMRSSLMSGNR